jgi:hypothetical protein
MNEQLCLICFSFSDGSLAQLELSTVGHALLDEAVCSVTQRGLLIKVCFEIVFDAPQPINISQTRQSLSQPCTKCCCRREKEVEGANHTL